MDQIDLERDPNPRDHKRAGLKRLIDTLLELNEAFAGRGEDRLRHLRYRVDGHDPG
jgi:hypothetical protein